VANCQSKVLSTNPLSAKCKGMIFFHVLFIFIYYKGVPVPIFDTLIALVFLLQNYKYQRKSQQKNFPKDNIYEFFKFSYFVGYSK